MNRTKQQHSSTI